MDDLVKRLWLHDCEGITREAADRIEELEVNMADKEAECRSLRGQVNIAKAKLAKVAAAYRLEAMKRDDYNHDAFDRHIAELKVTKQ